MTPDKELATREAIGLQIPMLPIEDLKKLTAYVNDVKKALMIKGQDYIVDYDGRQYTARSGFAKLAQGFGLSDEVVNIKPVFYDDFKQFTYTHNVKKQKVEETISTKVYGFEAVIKVTNIQSGRYAHGEGACTIEELMQTRNMDPKWYHRLLATAKTRAWNRAVSNYVGSAEISAEEMGLDTEKKQVDAEYTVKDKKEEPRRIESNIREEAKPAETPNLKEAKLDTITESIIVSIQRENKGLSRAQILAKIAEEKTKAAGLITDEAAAVLVASSLVKQPESTGFKSASELPKVPDDFRPCEEAAHIIDYIVKNYSQQLDTVRALVYKEMNAAEPHLTDVEAAKAVQASFEERSKPADDGESTEADIVYNAIQRAALDGEIIEVVSPGYLKTRKKKGSEKREFLGDRWHDYNDVLRTIGYQWIKDGENSHWEKDLGV